MNKSNQTVPKTDWSRITKDDQGQYIIRDFGCDCCATSGYYPKDEWDDWREDLTLADVDELEKNLRAQLALAAELREKLK